MKTDNQIFNPANLPKDLLIENFVVRTKVFERIFKDIKTGKMKFPEQHYIIQGTRGMGKTTMLLRLKYEIENSPELDSWLMPVFFCEETYDVSSISNLWEKLLKYLDDVWQTGGNLYKQTAQFVGNDEYEKRCYQILKDVLQERKKKIILFFDNFGELFLDYLSDEESHRLREILMNCSDIRIIAASSVVIKDLHDYSKPFFDFFKIIHLEGLSKEEALQLIVKMQEKEEKKIDIKRQKAKIETLAVLSGGVIRSIVLLYEVLLADEDGSALKYLDSILNWLTPLYKHRMEDLPVQQRKIVDIIAKQWDAISTKEIAEKIRENGKPLNSKLVSAQLAQLEKNNIVEKKVTTTKNHLYQLRERFFNIWYLMRNGDSYDKKRVIWLTRFLEAWYDDNKSIGGFIDSHIAKLKTGIYDPNAALLIAEAVSNAKDLEIEKQHELIEETRKILPDGLKAKLPASYIEKFEEAVSYVVKREIEPALAIANTIPEDDSLVIKGVCKLMLGEYVEGIKYLEKAYRNGHKEAAKTLGDAYEKQLLNYKKALYYYLEDIKQGNSNSYLSIASLYAYKLHDISMAEKYFKMALELNVQDSKIRAASFYQYIKTDYKTAKVLFEQVLEKDDLRVLTNLAYIENKLGRVKEAIGLYKRAIEEKIDLHYAYLMLGMIYLELNDFANAENCFTECLEFTGEHNLEKTFLSIIYFTKREKKVMALNYIESSIVDFYEEGTFFWLVIIRLWNNKFDDLNMFFENLSSGKFNFEDGKISSVLTLLLVKKQYHLVLNYFNDESFNFKDKFKPLYYALMHYLKDEYPNEFIKMGKELEQPVKEMIENIEKMREDYK